MDKKPSPYEIFTGEEARDRMPKPQLERYCKQFASETTPKMADITAHIDAQLILEKEQEGIRGKIARVFKSQNEQRQEIYDRNQGKYEKAVYREILAAVDKGLAAVAKNPGNGDLIGFVGLSPLPGSTSENPIFEFNRAFIHPNYRNEGVYTKLRQELIDRHQNATFVSNTTRPEVKKLNSKNGWQPLAYEEYAKLKNWQTTPEQLAAEANKDQYFILRPKAKVVDLPITKNPDNADSPDVKDESDTAAAA